MGDENFVQLLPSARRACPSEIGFTRFGGVRWALPANSQFTVDEKRVELGELSTQLFFDPVLHGARRGWDWSNTDMIQEIDIQDPDDVDG